MPPAIHGVKCLWVEIESALSAATPQGSEPRNATRVAGDRGLNKLRGPGVRFLGQPRRSKRPTRFETSVPE